MNPGESNLEAEVSMERLAVEVPEDPPFHIFVMGDFSGSAGSDTALIPFEIDRDEFSSVLKRIAPRVRIEVGDSGTIEIGFEKLDDFHPDEIFRRHKLFQELRDTRSRLANADTFQTAAGEVREWFSDSRPELEPKTEAPAEPLEIGDESDLLDDILDARNRDRAAYEPAEKSLLKEFVREIVGDHIVKVDEEEQTNLLAAIDSVTSGLMRTILHDSRFKRLEAAWRGLFLMCRRIETTSVLKIFIADIDKERFLDGLKDEEDGDLVNLLLYGHQNTGNEPWALIAGIYDFDLNVDDIAGLMRVARISSVVTAPFVSHIRPGMLGIRSFSEKPASREWDLTSETEEGKLWTALRTSEESVSVGLLVPRLMARLPYGTSTDPTELFDFEEFTGIPSHDEYLWMNPAFGFSIVLAQSFSRLGWEIGGRYELDISGLPMHVYHVDGESLTKPCAEIEMTDVSLQTLLEQGLMPFASFRNTDRVRLGGVQSVKFPQKALKGRWI